MLNKREKTLLLKRVDAAFYALKEAESQMVKMRDLLEREGYLHLPEAEWGCLYANRTLAQAYDFIEAGGKPSRVEDDDT